MSLGALGLIAGGVVLVYSGVNDPAGGPIGVLRSVLQGELPQPGPQGTTAGGTSVGGAVGGAAGRAVAELAKKQWHLGPVREHVAIAASEVGNRFGLKTIGGWREYDQFPDHPSGLALDFMINNIPNGKATGDAIAAYLISNAARLKVDYLIWYGRSYKIKRGTWLPYSATSNKHTDHVHATFLP